jgi:hypothetical protein
LQAQLRSAVERLVGIDAANAKKLSKLSEKIARDGAMLASLDKEIDLGRKAGTRIKELVEERKKAYGRENEQAIIDHAPVERTDRAAYADWARSISDWLYNTAHVRVLWPEI